MGGSSQGVDADRDVVVVVVVEPVDGERVVAKRVQSR